MDRKVRQDMQKRINQMDKGARETCEMIREAIQPFIDSLKECPERQVAYRLASVEYDADNEGDKQAHLIDLFETYGVNLLDDEELTDAWEFDCRHEEHEDKTVDIWLFAQPRFQRCDENEEND